jgi:predicted transcriptional regulator
MAAAVAEEGPAAGRRVSTPPGPALEAVIGPSVRRPGNRACVLRTLFRPNRPEIRIAPGSRTAAASLVVHPDACVERVTLSYTRPPQDSAMGSLTIRLDPQLEKSLARLARQTGRTKSEVARDALRRQLLLQEFRSVRRGLLPHAEAVGWITDEDVFRDVS